MQVIMLQISDIHIQTGRESVLLRAHNIKDACHGVAPSAGGCVIVISGDVAFSGKTSEYDAAYSFMNELQSKFLTLPSMGKVDFIAVPGNHDCNFEDESDIRQYLIQNLDALYASGIRPSSDRVKAILEVQKNFFAFEARLVNGKEVGFDERLNYGRIVNFDNFSIRFQCYNTAWLSRKHELQSKLFLPEEAIEPISVEANVCASVFHHPYNWLDANNYRLLRDTVEQTSDLVLTGHEHHAGGGVVDRFSGEHLHYSEAAALQGGGGDLDSGFTLLIFDTETGTQRLEQFGWNGEYYASKNKTNWSAIIKNPARERHLFRLNPIALEQLTDPGAAFSHKKKRNLRLSDIYIYPDLLEWSAKKLVTGNRKIKTINSKEVLEHFRMTSKILVTGRDDSGKTALLRKLFLDLSAEYVPLLISGADFEGKFSEVRFRKIISLAVERYYDGNSAERFLQLDPARRILLLDDFHKTNLSHINELKLIEFAENMFGHIFISAADVYRVGALTRRALELDPLRAFESCELREFGHRLRAQLINKWLSIGRDTASELQAVEYETRATEKIITTLLGKNVVPASPFNILTILQTIEAVQPHAATDGSYGSLYEVLIKTNLQSSGDDKRDETEVKFTYISVIAYAIFDQERSSISESELRKVHEEYTARFGYSPGFKGMIANLVSAKILETVDGSYAFKYKHFYYYFVAKYFERALRRNDDRSVLLRSKLEYMADRLHNEEMANILVFYLYLTQDWALSQHILSNARKIYADKDICDFEKHVEFVNKIYKSPPRLLIEDSDVEGHRDEYRQKQDEADQDDTGLSFSLDAKVTYDDGLADIHKLNIAFKTLQVLGQVLRSSVDSMEGDVKHEIATTCCMLGLRSLSALLALAEDNIEGFRLYLSLLIKERATFDKIEMSDQELLNRTDEALIWMTMACSYGTVKKIAFAAGHPHLEDTYVRILEDHENSLAIKLVDLAVKLDGHSRTVPITEITEINKLVTGNLFSETLLRRMVADFLYLNRVEVRTMQKLGSLLKIEGVTGAAFLLPDKKTN